MTSEFHNEDLMDNPYLVPARMLNEFVYCPRLAYLEWVQNEFRDSVDTLEGRFRHQRVDEPDNQSIEPDGDEHQEQLSVRSVMLSAPSVGLIARIDLLETDGDMAIPVDYKKGKVPDNPQKSWEPERIQLCAQGLILRENGFMTDAGVIYYVASKTRITILFDDELIAATLNMLSEFRRVVSCGLAPPPLADSPKCIRCSLVGICLPDEVHLLSQVEDTEDTAEVRRLVPARDDNLDVYVQEQGATVGKHGEVLVIRKSQEIIQQVRMLEVSQLSLYGNVQITAQVLRELLDRGIPVCHFSYGGWFSGITHGMTHKNVQLRQKQFGVAADAGKSLQLARNFVFGKIKNCRTLLRRNHVDAPSQTLQALNKLAQDSREAKDAQTLLGIEGAAARAYFGQFEGMLKGSYGQHFDFNTRNRRPPTDEVNALLSMLYSLLAKDFSVMLLTVGFDPYLGFFHRPRYGRPALALDLIEEFRPLIGDSVVLTLINGGEIQKDDFIRQGMAVALTPRGRKKLIVAYERRLDSLVTHPVFGYSISYRRVFEVQARLLARQIMGEIPLYPVFLTR